MVLNNHAMISKSFLYTRSYIIRPRDYIFYPVREDTLTRLLCALYNDSLC